MRWALLSAAFLALAACGIDAPPTPPGQDNPDTISDPSDINIEGLF